MDINVTNKLSEDTTYKESGWRNPRLIRPYPIKEEVEVIIKKK